MLPKKNRTPKKILDKIWKQGQVVRSKNLTFRFLQTRRLSSPKISFLVPKTVGGSVLRNTLRRRGYSALRPHFDSLPLGLIGAMIYTPKKENEKNFTQVNKLVSEILKNFF